MIRHAPQLIVGAIYAGNLLMAAHEHGRPRTGNRNFWSDSVVIVELVLLLWWGGFWR